jgi:hypothetical protein
MINFENLEIYSIILDVCVPFKIDPSASIEMEEFFKDLLKEYQDEFEEISFKRWLSQKVKDHFQAVDKRPEWIQGADWPIVEGKPALFITQVDLPFDKHPILANFYHDDVAYYLFLDYQGKPHIKMQQF